MRRGDIVVPTEFKLDDCFYLDIDPMNDPNNMIQWNRGETGLILNFENEDTMDEMWAMVLIPAGVGYCYAIELKTI